VANYNIYGVGKNMFDTLFGIGNETGRTVADALLYVSSDGFGLLNADGSKTFFTGTGLVWDAASGQFTDGYVNSIAHFSNGRYIDGLTGLNMDFGVVNNLPFGSLYFEQNALQYDDVLNASVRAGGGAHAVTLHGRDGNDQIFGGLGSDKLFGDNGNDSLAGGGGNDLLSGGLGDDSLKGGSGADRLLAGDGADHATGGNGNDIFFGSTGDDVLVGGANTDTAIYAAGFSELSILKTASGFAITSADGVDTLTGIEQIATDTGTYAFNTTSQSWAKVSATVGAALIDRAGVLTGTSSADVLNAGAEINLVRGLGGDDTISAGDALVLGGAGNDTLSAGPGGRVYGEAGNDTLTFGRLLDGGAGNDTLHGSYADSILTGGAGADIFDFSYSLYANPRGQIVSAIPWGNNTITDFQIGVDTIALHDNTAGIPGYALSETLTHSGQDWLLTLNINGVAQADSTVLFKGLGNVNLTLADLGIMA
jgi:Ca2+-binding RTX toxin-like protein